MEAEWEAREPEVSGVRLELDQSATAGSLRVRILSHTVGGLRHYGAVVTPEGAEPGSLPVVLFTHGEDDGVAVELTFLLTPILQAQGLSVPSSYRPIGRNPSDSGTRCSPPRVYPVSLGLGRRRYHVPSLCRVRARAGTG